jgi:hypothetical protein
MQLPCLAVKHLPGFREIPWGLIRIHALRIDDSEWLWQICLELSTCGLFPFQVVHCPLVHNCTGECVFLSIDSEDNNITYFVIMNHLIVFNMKLAVRKPFDVKDDCNRISVALSDGYYSTNFLFRKEIRVCHIVLDSKWLVFSFPEYREFMDWY